jgi:hypothetical protein
MRHQIETDSRDTTPVVTLFLHRDVTGHSGTEDALIPTYDTPDDSGGSVVLTLDEPVSVEEDRIVADGPVGEGGRTGDSYESERFSHTWAENYTDGLEEMVVLSGSDPADTEAYSSAVDVNVTFDV